MAYYNLKDQFTHLLIRAMNILKNLLRGDLQDGRGVRHGDHLPTHKYIKNTSTCGTTPIEHLLDAG